ncbi:MAG TPA: SRPBCC family protein [Candidatus Limnocylindrales bacterium]
MASYSFVTVWQLDAPIGRVYDAIRDSLAWPSWWRAVTAVEELDPGDPVSGVGSVRRYTFKGALPYSLAFDLRVERVEAPGVLAGRASGELEGTGVWTLTQEGSTTIARYDWNVSTTRWWMNLLAPLAAPIFRRNHDFVMSSGARGLCTLLGGVSGTCSWVDKPRWSWRS